MEPEILALKYDKIAQLWQDEHFSSQYGIKQFEKVLSFVKNRKKALDVGCGVGGRFIHILEEEGFSITGVDVSKEMVSLASKNHINQTFLHEDICIWHTKEKFDFIFAWDSIFHLPYDKQKGVISKLANMLNKDGVLFYTFGNENGEHTDTWLNDTFYYSSIGINENIQVLIENKLSILHIELDQYPLKHVFVAAAKI